MTARANRRRKARARKRLRVWRGRRSARREKAFDAFAQSRRVAGYALSSAAKGACVRVGFSLKHGLPFIETPHHEHDLVGSTVSKMETVQQEGADE